MTTQTSTSASNYINLHAQGIGYLSRVRNVVPRKGGSFVACSINAMFGEKGVKDGVQYTAFDVKAVNEEVAELLKQAQADANNKDRIVMVRFRISDFYPDSYTIESGDNAGQIRMCLKGRLLMITHMWAKDKGAEKYELMFERPEAAPAAAAAPAEQAEPASA